ncbi:glycosyltransferase family 2 protein [Paenibacillus sp. NPDC057934]|uniref:glycosyltransferase family 2 protein n=1 Tax=Paenibacillus sp. NPDC057934 TaxID=3346282 RepID=UPI0036D9FFB4
MGQTISLVMIVKNEEKTLKRCLESVLSYVNEIIIVDTGSTDNTKQIASGFGAKIFNYSWCDNFADARNFALSQSTSQWNLVLDADEYISNECGNAIQDFINGNPALGKIRRIDTFINTDGMNSEQIYISRLFPSYCRYYGRVHEQIISDLPRVKVDIEIQHDGYYGQQKSNRNIPLLKKEIEEKPQDPYYYYQIAKEYRGLEEHEQAFNHLKEAYKWLTRQEGYAPSVIVNYLYAIIASGHLADGLNIIDNEQKFLNNYADFFFVSALYLLELIQSNPAQFNELIPLIEHYYLKALEIGETGQEGSVIGAGSFAAHHNLGVFYEVIGDIEKATQQYIKAAAYNYKPSNDRLIYLGL